MARALLAIALLCALASPAMAARHRPVCVEVRDPGVGAYRICAPAPRRR